ncbi:MAG: FAD-binding protein, partial [Candidatus Binatia bacterium]
MDLHYDYLIIGSGLAAFAAALELRESGASVALLSHGPGGTGMASGAWDLADPALAGRPLSWRAMPPLAERLAHILREQEFHPYTVLQRGLRGVDFAEFFESSVERAAQALPLNYRRAKDSALALLTPLGTVKLTDAAQYSIAAGDLNQMVRGRLLVVGVAGYVDFSPRFIAQSLIEEQETQAQHPLEFIGTTEIDVPGVKNTHSLAPIEIALALDQERHFVAFGQAIVRYLQHKVYTHLLLPPVLGIQNTAQILAALERITGLRVAESLAFPASMPGWRLHLAIQDFCAKQGIALVEGRAVEAGAVGRRLRWIRVEHRGEARRLTGGGFVLATGKFLGGGVRRNGRLEETLLKLPIFSDGRPVGDRSLMSLAEKAGGRSQPFLRAGIRVNGFAQPLDGEGEVAYDNLAAAGTVL